MTKNIKYDKIANKVFMGNKMLNFNDFAASIVYKDIQTISAKKFICGYCGNLVSSEKGYKISGDVPITNSSRSTYWNHDVSLGVVYQCPHCKMPIFYHELAKEFVPGEKIGSEIKNLPDLVNKIYDETRKCFCSGCYTACIMICRKILMNLAVENGAKEGDTFFNYVEFLDQKNYIPPNGKEWVNYIRTQGNEANHEISIKDKEEAKNILKFVEMLLQFSYEFQSLIPKKEKDK